MNISPLRGKLYAAFAAALIAAAFVFTPIRAASAAGSVTYSGRAVALRIDGVENPTPGQIIIADTGPLPATGGSLSASESAISRYGGALVIDQASALVSGAGPETSADTALTNYHVEFITHSGKHVTINADYIGASASASVARNGKVSVTSNVTVQNLVVNGQPITVTGQQNQVVEVTGTEARLTFNQVTSAVDKQGCGQISVAAVHFEICECISGNMGQIEAGICVSGPPPPPVAGECGKLTGGGWILSSTGEKCTFGVSGGIRRGEFWGDLNYIHHGTGMHVKSTAVTGYSTNPSVPDARIITYNVTIDGVAGTATVDAWDRGEPGRDDFFAIRLSNGYSAQGTLGGDRPGGGNLQLHKCPPGWE